MCFMELMDKLQLFPLVRIQWELIDVTLIRQLMLGKNFSVIIHFSMFRISSAGVPIMNRPVVACNVTCTLRNVTVDESTNNAYVCENCNYVGKSAQALRLHKLKGHGVKKSSPINAIVGKSHDIYACDHLQCNHISKSVHDLQLHKLNHHTENVNYVCNFD